MIKFSVSYPFNGIRAFDGIRAFEQVEFINSFSYYYNHITEERRQSLFILLGLFLVMVAAPPKLQAISEFPFC